MQSHCLLKQEVEEEAQYQTIQRMTSESNSRSQAKLSETGLTKPTKECRFCAMTDGSGYRSYILEYMIEIINEVSIVQMRQNLIPQTDVFMRSLRITVENFLKCVSRLLSIEKALKSRSNLFNEF